MKTVVLTVNDDSKFHLLANFLQEVRFIEMEAEIACDGEIKKIGKLPRSVLHPVKAENFGTFSRDDLHDRQSFH
ncbi:MAG: hypothetical protein BECKG1743D_GA0114223_100768 [Candidatus Kentron sp. G]|uniref:Uncharacterized protein n=1 Tax=Candidatus Kentrum sp. FM TaxID=2126340 RepID=A0A450TMH9_9GAMM|nr:MAG: hypothetical protein BECKFM1743C_GA0114222_105052 [Candidatus Kentron sp. FM]VFM95414.1 MAG: hypothetical protein BECKG1743F_GA0114225_100673 [Candidatus Kentron sp. G]VFJ69496.1 MAG: hypothetical protein BECKFM1743A_GA0114220_105124 [Candidatus Kentron sp. FM]VFK17721.1 MAG: hypothetical protein BECKFM1743B_GA0114221_104994 [Candidatus Kentron sp. FM]VFM96513.1 MAG: hypothetical protein BECKG1743E_GA0114224_100653 [Candidatus Kentron sp. G]